MSEKINVAEIFGENVFNDTVMKERLPKNVYKNLKLAMKGEKELQLADADVIANEMKDWAIEKGATHYTHWFQPLTGSTAEKHDSFISAPNENGKVLMVLLFASLQLSVLIQVKLLTRRHLFFVQWMQSTNSLSVF